jgi:uncharacterized membrane protein
MSNIAKVIIGIFAVTITLVGIIFGAEVALLVILLFIGISFVAGTARMIEEKKSIDL